MIPLYTHGRSRPNIDVTFAYAQRLSDGVQIRDLDVCPDHKSTDFCIAATDLAARMVEGVFANLTK